MEQIYSSITLDNLLIALRVKLNEINPNLLLSSVLL